MSTEPLKKNESGPKRLKCDARCKLCWATQGGHCKLDDGHIGAHHCNSCDHNWGDVN